MANPTTNFGWEMPTSTDLVTSLPADFETFGQAVDTTLAELKGGTTGQVLSKTSATNMDFTWVTPAAAGMTNPMTTTGDTIYSSSGSTPARLGIGSSGQVLTVSGGVPSWATPSSGGMTLLESGSLSGASVTTGTLSGSYNNLELYIYAQDLATNNENIRMRFNGDSNARYATNGADQSASTSFSVNYIEIASDTSDVNPYGIIKVHVPLYSVSGFYKTAIIDFVTGVSTANFVSARRIGAYNQTGAITSMTFFPGVGNWAGGSYRVYGVK